jgi:hypothetical protein
MCRTCMFPVVDMTVVDQIPRRERFRAHTSSLYLIYACLPLLRLGNRWEPHILVAYVIFS